MFNGFLSKFIFIAAIFLALLSCSKEKPAEEDSYISSCYLNEDQSGTLLGRWPIAPLQLAFHDSSQFSAQEKDIIKEAAGVWNLFFEANFGFPVFKFQSIDQPGYEQFCAGQNAVLYDSNGFKKPIIIYKRREGMDDRKNNIAVTNQCRTKVEGEDLMWVTSGQIELNYQFFFAPEKESADLRFTMLHEFGHLLGLDHSCEINTNRKGMPDCNLSEFVSSYLKAVMFPSNSGSELKTKLQENDQLRANCIYEKSF